MLRNAEGSVIFLQSWWRCSLRYAANAIGRWQRDVEQVQADPVVNGQTSIYKRYWNDNSFKEHEAFLAGTTVDVNFLLPSEIGLDDFKRIMETAGRYAGLSPYGYKQDFGRFQVLSVTRREVHAGDDIPVGQPDQSSAGTQGTTCQEIDVRPACTERR
jgi:hypothetical protein